MSDSISKQDQIQEIQRCSVNPIYFITRYVKISHPQRGVIPFDTYDYQDRLVKNYKDNRFNIILKPRQMGVTTITSAYILWFTLFQREKNVLLAATKQDVAKNILSKVKSMLKRLPEWLVLPETETNNKTNLEFDNGSSISATTTSSDIGRSEALSLLVVDEAAHVDGMAELWKSMYPTLSEGGSCIALSTPQGTGNWFHKTFTQAQSGENSFNAIQIDWDEHPQRDEEWFREETKNMSKRDINQEYLCKFLGSGRTVIDSEYITKMEENDVEDPEPEMSFDSDLWVWEEYDPAHTYFIAADVSRGDGEDYSAFHVFQTENFEQVAEYKGKLPPERYAPLLKNIGERYGEAMLIVENNTYGYNVLRKLEKAEYDNLFYSKKSTHEYVDPYEARRSSSNSIVPGIATTRKSRPLMISQMTEYIRNGDIHIRSQRTVNEMKTFIWNNKDRAEAQKGYNDDLMMSLAIACWVRETAIRENKQAQKYSQATLSAIKKSESKMDMNLNDRQSAMQNPLYRKAQEFDKSDRERNRERQKQKYKDYIWLL